MKPIVKCENPEYGTLSFYLVADSRRYFLFSQAYRKNVAHFFRNGMRLADIQNFSKSKNDTAVAKIMSKLPSYIKYIEKEYDISVLRETQKKKKHPHKASGRYANTRWNYYYDAEYVAS